MIERRYALAGLGALVVSPVSAFAHKKKFKLNKKYLPQLVEFHGYPPGKIVVDPRNRFLYLVEQPGLARRYGVGVGRAGLAWKGAAVVGRKAKWPRWQPTKNIIRREPHKNAQYADGVPGGPGNPLGARALYLYRNGRDTMYRIHGTNEPSSIGRAVSNGCIRMLNSHAKDLYRRVPVGAEAIVL